MYNGFLLFKNMHLVQYQKLCRPMISLRSATFGSICKMSRFEFEYKGVALKNANCRSNNNLPKLMELTILGKHCKHKHFCLQLYQPKTKLNDWIIGFDLF